MKQSTHNFNESSNLLLQHFYVRDREWVESKISRFKSLGADRLHAVLDFDHTLTAGKKAGQNVGTWDVLDAFIPEEGRLMHDEIYRSHRAHELAGELNDAEAVAWWSETLDLICSYRPDVHGAEKSFLEIAKLRDGGLELFDSCDLAGVPTIVLSAGVRQITEILVQHYGVHPSLILSTDLVMDATGHAVGWKRESLIHMLNKREMGHAELLDMRAKRDNVLLVGDVPDDARMVLGDESVLRIRVIDPRKGEYYDPDKVLQTSFEAGFDLVVDHSLQPVAKLMDWICS